MLYYYTLIKSTIQKHKSLQGGLDDLKEEREKERKRRRAREISTQQRERGLEDSEGARCEKEGECERKRV